MSLEHVTIDKENRDDLVLNLPKLLVSAGEIYEKAGDQLVFGPFNLTTGQYIVLAILTHHSGSPSMTELKNMMMRSPSNLTQLIDNLQKQGLVERVPSPTDRRVNLIQMTYAGHNLMKEVESFFHARMREYLGEFSDDELRAFITMLIRLMNGAAEKLGLNRMCIPEIDS